MRRNDDYWRKPAELDGISWRIVADADTMRLMFESGEIDVFNTDFAQSQIPYFANSDKYKDQLVTGNRMGIYYFTFNQDIEPFGDVRVRKALQMAVDRQGMLDALYDGRGVLVEGIFAPGLLGYNPDLPKIPYDPEAAKKLLAEAGYPDGFDMKLSMIADNPDILARNELFQAMMAEIGINVTIDQMDEAAWHAVRADGLLPAYTQIWSADYNDPDNFLYPFFAPGNTAKRSFNFKNEGLANRVSAVRAIVDPEARVKEYRALEKAIIRDEAAWIPLFAPQHIFVVAEMCDFVYVMYAGRIMEQADVFELFDNALHPYTTGLLGAIPRACSIFPRAAVSRPGANGQYRAAARRSRNFAAWAGGTR